MVANCHRGHLPHQVITSRTSVLRYPRDAAPSRHRAAKAAPGHSAMIPYGFYYSPAWRRLRQVALQRDGYRCTVCGVSVAGPGQARVDHIKPTRTHPHLALSLANLRSLCALHDNQSHREKGRRYTAQMREQRFVFGGCDARGLPLDPAHHWLRPDSLRFSKS